MPTLTKRAPNGLRYRLDLRVDLRRIADELFLRAWRRGATTACRGAIRLRPVLLDRMQHQQLNLNLI